MSCWEKESALWKHCSREKAFRKLKDDTSNPVRVLPFALFDWVWTMNGGLVYSLITNILALLWVNQIDLPLLWSHISPLSAARHIHSCVWLQFWTHTFKLAPPHATLHNSKSPGPFIRYINCFTFLTKPIIVSLRNMPLKWSHPWNKCIAFHSIFQDLQYSFL